MLCKRCHRRPAKAKLPGIEPLCKECFSRLIGLRVRKYIRLNKIFRKADRILVFEELSLYFVRSIVKDLPVKIFFKKDFVGSVIDNKRDERLEGFIKKNKINRVVVPWALDNEICAFLEELVYNKKTKIDYIKLFVNVREDELNLFAKFKNLKFISIKKDEKLSNMLDELEERYADVKFGLRKSLDRLT